MTIQYLIADTKMFQSYLFSLHDHVWPILDDIFQMREFSSQ